MLSSNRIRKFSKARYYKVLKKHKQLVRQQNVLTGQDVSLENPHREAAQSFSAAPPVPSQSLCAAPPELSQSLPGAPSHLHHLDLVDELKIIFGTFNPPRRMITLIMKSLQRHVDENICIDKRTLLQTPRSTIPPKCVNPGKYTHIGIQNALQSFPDEEFLRSASIIEINIGIDGCPLAKSGQTMWPILGMFLGNKYSPFLIGIYAGHSDPEDPELFLEDLCEEIERLEQFGILIASASVPKPFKVNAIICDSKARPYLTGVISYTGHHGCGRCNCVAETIDGRITFPTYVGDLKTDESFQQRRDQLSHKYPFPYGFEKANMKMVTQFPLCSMHLVYLGVMRTLGALWFTPKAKAFFKINPSTRELMNTKHLSLSKFVPLEFSRKPDSFRFVKRWKATQCRQFLLYTGVVVLKEILDEVRYTHFLLLSVAVRILSSESFVSNNHAVNQAEEMLKLFVETYPDLYGHNQVVYNVHNLLHLTDCVRQYGVLEDISAFPFENFMQILKTKINPCAPVIPQVINRIEEEKSLSSIQQAATSTSDYLFEKKVNLKRDVFGCGFMYKTCKFNKCEFTTAEADRYCITKDGDIVKIKGFGQCEEEAGVFGFAFNKKSSFFNNPVDSTLLGIFLVSDVSRDLQFWAMKEIHCKAMMLPYHDVSVVFPLLHTKEPNILDSIDSI